MSALRRLLVINGGGYTLLDHLRTNNAGVLTPYRVTKETTIDYIYSHNNVPNDGKSQEAVIGRYMGKSKQSFGYIVLQMGPSYNRYFGNAILYLGNFKVINNQKYHFQKLNRLTYYIDNYELTITEDKWEDCDWQLNIGNYYNKLQLSDLNIYQFSVNGEIWYPCKKGDVYGLYCPARDLSGAQESDYWIYNEKFTGD
jgi:hypothetical protein